MKNFLLFCFLLLASSIKIQAQSYPSIFGNDNTVWNVLGYDFTGGFPYQPPTMTHTIKGDTLINNLLYKEVTTTVSRISVPVPNFWIREDLNTGKIWTRFLVGPDTNERLLMDFAMNVGDTFKREQHLPWIVVKSVYYDSLNRKHIIFDDDHLIGYGTTGYNIEFITGVGNNWGLRYNYRFSSYEIEDLILICAHKDREQVYKDTGAVFGNNCSYPLGLSNIEKEKNSFIISPNPVTEHLSVTLSAGALSAIVYNVAGQKMTTLSGSPQSMKIDCSQWPPGLYVLRLQDKSGSVSSQTFLKQ